ncbi:DUF5992 family protein [Streptomyces sp. NPDC096095]|uniref:DUF5992 family protein n=1 Tax=Streptomyces sp. NPDC096095 TaxID=3155545 RepID=UPI00331F0B2C
MCHLCRHLEIFTDVVANVGSVKSTSVVVSGGAGNCMNTVVVFPASRGGIPVVHRQRFSVSRKM